MALPPAALPVVLPLQGDPVGLLDAVSVLVARWPADVDAGLVVPAGRLTDRDRGLLRSLGDDVRVVELPEPSPCFGALVAAVGGDAPFLLLDPSALPDADALRDLASGTPADGGLLLDPAVVADAPVLTAAHDLPSFAALLTTTRPVAVEDLADAVEVRVPAFDRDAPVRTGTVSIVLPVRGQLARTQACLASLRRSTRRPYELVVVDHGSTDGTRAWLAAQRDLVVVTTDADLGHAAACNAGIAASRGDTVVLLAPQTVVPRFWVEGLLRALAADARVAAAGPRLAGLPGRQGTPAGGYRDLAGYRTWADAWRREHDGQGGPTRQLSTACLAVRREALLEVGGLDEAYVSDALLDVDLCLRLRRAGWDLRVADDVVVHHEGPARPAAGPDAYLHHRATWGRTLGEETFLSAALIVKDEQAALPRCLASLRGVVDELVVCDTGSSDRTVEIAEAFGARVLHAPWTGDFAAARNVPLEACRGAWVLSIDADEQLILAAGVDLRQLLLAVETQAVAVTIRSRSDEDGGASFEHEAGRLFRRGDLRWVGAVHETLLDELTGKAPGYTTSAALSLDHDGYVGRVYEARDKGTRNLLLAEKDHEQAVTSGDSRLWKTAYELARALSKDDGNEQRVEQLLLQALASMPTGLTHMRCDAHVRLATALARQGRLHEAEQSARAALDASPGDAAALVVLGEVLAVGGRHEEALAALDAPAAAVPSALRDLAKADVTLPLLRARLLHRLSRTAEAAAVLLDLSASHPASLDWPLLHECLRDHVAGVQVLAGIAARDPEAALAALDGLPTTERDALHAALADLGVDADACTPAALRAVRLDAALRGHDADAVAQAALALEDTDLASALDLWSRVPDSDTVRVARARCLVQLGRTGDAVAAVDGVDVDGLSVTDLLVVAAVAAAAGDLDTARVLLEHADRTAPHDLVQTVTSLARTLGVPLPDRVHQGA